MKTAYSKDKAFKVEVFMKNLGLWALAADC